MSQASSSMIFETQRLIIRNYRDEDRPVFAAIGGNPQARTYNGGVLTPAESDSFIDKQIETIDRIGCGFAVVERKTDGAVVGDVGIRPVPDELPFGKNEFEIGWQLDPQYFGKGYASESAKVWTTHGFRELQLDEVVTYTATLNTASENVMKRIGMTRDPSRDFDHPKMPQGHPLRPQIVYSISTGLGRVDLHPTQS
jgi:RimJ/RimL family protein N-acetyltransferase